MLIGKSKFIHSFFVLSAIAKLIPISYRTTFGLCTVLVGFAILFLLVSELLGFFDSSRLGNLLKSGTSLMKGEEKEIEVKNSSLLIQTVKFIS